MLKEPGPKGDVRVLVSATDIDSLKNVKGLTVLYSYKPGQTALISLPRASLFSLLQNDHIRFASLWRQPMEELTTGAFDLSLNKISLVHSRYPAYTGNTVLLSIKEQRFDTTDIDWKNRYVNTGVSASTESIHASIMATIIAGGGNSSAFAKGAAWGSAITSSDFTSLLPDATQVYLNNRINLQNHSYGTGIENFYGADAASYDLLVYQVPTLVHVFSAGNSGTASSPSGAYAGLDGFANITGSFKMAKNIITTGHVDSANLVLPLSSRGPAYDGRIKPELVAFGEDGSSGAAALVSGTVALLQQAYKEAHSNNYPSAALIKAILLNSADDVGAKGIDYISGYGSLNAYQAMRTLTANHFLEDAVADQQTKSFPITVPPDIAQLKITVAWTDTAAAPNASRALVNDIDALLVLPSASQSWQPWVLNSKPQIDSLLLPAIRATDTLNNVEQITIDHPQAGNYNLEISGAKIATAMQSFAVAWQMDTANSFVWTYPSSPDIIRAGEKNYLRWQTAIAGTGQLEYSKDGSSWQTISSGVDLSSSYFVWDAPDTITTALVRMQVPALNLQFVSDSFVVSPLLQMNVGFNCADSFLLYWNSLPVHQYQLYQLGDRYLEGSLSIADTFQVLQKQQFPSLYYAVAPMAGSRPGLKSFTINYTTQGVECYLRSFFSLLQNNQQALLTLELGTVYNVAEVSFQKKLGDVFQTIHTISSPASVLQSFVDGSLVQGINRYRARIKLIDGTILYSGEDQVLYFPGQPVIVFPNPAAQQQPVNLIVKDQGVYAIRLYDATGRLVRSFELNDILTTIPPFVLPRGLYFIQVNTATGKLFAQKLVVY
jgi:hypothetical protein